MVILDPLGLKGTLGLQNWISDHLNLNPMVVLHLYLRID